MSRQSAALPARTTVRYLLSALRLNRKSLSWMTTRKDVLRRPWPYRVRSGETDCSQLPHPGPYELPDSRPQESRAWTIKVGTKAPQAAGKIHSDFERGFIRAEVVNYDDLMACGSMNAAKEKGLVRSEGKEYVMRDGDVVLFRFNV